MSEEEGTERVNAGNRHVVEQVLRNKKSTSKVPTSSRTEQLVCVRNHSRVHESIPYVRAQEQRPLSRAKATPTFARKCSAYFRAQSLRCVSARVHSRPSRLVPTVP
eukprot:6214539-Pleurochrysis_carterae.AAC.1